MRTLIAVVLLLAGAQQEMVAPKVERKQESHTQTTETVTRICPAGYEGHFVDIPSGFEWPEYWEHRGYGSNLVDFGGAPGYTVCFKKSFMDEIRKNPDMITDRPAPPRPI